MKFLIFLLAFILLPAQLLHSQDSWHKQFCDSTKMLRKIYFINENTGWAVGWTGNVLNTTNGGDSWNSQISGTIKRLNSVYFINPDTGFISSSGFILKTLNSGTNWDKISIDTFVNNKKFEFRELYFPCIDTGYLLGTILESNGSDVFWDHWYLLKSYDGLKSFEIIDKGKYDREDSAENQFLKLYFPTRVYFHEGTIGYKIVWEREHYMLSKTYDDGLTWSQKGWFKSIFFVSPKIGYAIINNFTIVKTTSGGE